MGLREQADAGVEGGPTRRLLSTVAERPITALLLWFFTVGQAVAFVPVVASPPNDPLPVLPFAVASTWIGLLLPVIVITWARGGKEGVAALLGCTTRVLAPWRWYVLPLAVVPLLSLAVVLAVQGPPTDTSLGAVSRAYLAGFLFQALVHCLMTNVWEELAWTNFVQDELQSRTTPTKAALITAPVFALQHAALVSDNSLTGAVVVMLALILLAVPFRMTMAWVFNRTGSTLLVGFTHACGNAVITGTATGAALVPMLYGRNFGPVHFFAFAVIGLVVAAVTRGRLGYAPVNLDGHAQKSSVGA